MMYKFDVDAFNLINYLVVARKIDREKDLRDIKFLIFISVNHIKSSISMNSEDISTFQV